MTAEALNKVLKGKLSGKGAVFIKASETNGISAMALASIAIHETGNGTSVAIKERNNAMGTMNLVEIIDEETGKKRKISVLRTFKKRRRSIAYTAKSLCGKLYIGAGKKTIAQIQEVYAPVGAANDPKSLNSHWRMGVTKYCNQIISAVKETTEVTKDAMLVANDK